MARPKGTYISQVFNFGVDKNIPFGFVDVVFDKSGNAVGFEKDGKFLFSTFFVDNYLTLFLI